MGHLFVLCGPPGSGKTTLLKEIQNDPNFQHLHLQQLQRMTTRHPRREEGDQGRSSLEYEFLTREEFASRLARRHVANFIEWNGSFYATDVDMLRKASESDADYLLLEDMPSAIFLKHSLSPKISIILLFTDGEEELLKLDFALLVTSRRPSVQEWRRRLAQKYAEGVRQDGKEPTDAGREEYINRKMLRAIPDLAFMAGKLKANDQVYVLANKEDQLPKTIEDFRQFVIKVKSSTAFVLMPFTDEFDKLHRFVIKPTIEKEELKCERGDEVFSKLDVVEDISHHIEKSTLIVSDISGGNPNVFLELGLAIKLKKKIILLSHDPKSPFDVSNYRQIKYVNTLDGWDKLARQLSDAIRKVKRGEDVAPSQ